VTKRRRRRRRQRQRRRRRRRRRRQRRNVSLLCVGGGSYAFTHSLTAPKLCQRFDSSAPPTANGQRLHFLANHLPPHHTAELPSSFSMRTQITCCRVVSLSVCAVVAAAGKRNGVRGDGEGGCRDAHQRWMNGKDARRQLVADGSGTGWRKRVIKGNYSNGIGTWRIDHKANAKVLYLFACSWSRRSVLACERGMYS